MYSLMYAIRPSLSLYFLVLRLHPSSIGRASAYMYSFLCFVADVWTTGKSITGTSKQQYSTAQIPFVTVFCSARSAVCKRVKIG